MTTNLERCGGHSIKCYTEGPARRSNPLTFYIPFLTKNVHVPLSNAFYCNPLKPKFKMLNPFDCCKCTVTKIWINQKPWSFPVLSTAIRRICSALLGPSTDCYWQIYLSFHIFQLMKPLFLHYTGLQLKGLNKVHVYVPLLWKSFLCISHCRECLPP